MISIFLEKAVGVVWNYPVIILCLFTGVYFTFFRLNFIQFKGLSHAIQLLKGKYDDPDEIGQITHFQALSAALSATIGLGNIAGVAIAIALGGPGAVFWMWLVGLLGMATKFIECTLGTHYRDENKVTKETRGGPKCTFYKFCSHPQ
jgi:AGCS family alanine or glycine:cation symporter